MTPTRFNTRIVNTLLIVLLLIPVATSYADMGQVYRDAEKLDNTTKSKRATKAVSDIKDTMKVALKNLQEAYDKKNIKQTYCVRGHLATTKGLLRIAEEAEVSLKEAMVTGQIDLINHEFVKISMALEKAKRAQSLLLGCTGDLSDPMKASQQTTKPEVSERLVQDYTPSSDESSVLVYETINSERPEAISLSE